MQSEDEPNAADPEILSASDLAAFKSHLLATLFWHTSMKLAIYQRGLLINGTRHFSSRKNKKTHQKPGLNSRNSLLQEESQLPDEKLLNAIKLDKDISALRQIYAVAIAECTAPTTEAPHEPHEQLVDAIEAQKPDRNEVERAQVALDGSKTTLKALKNQLEDERLAAEERQRVQEERLAQLRHNLRNVRLLNDLELRLVQKWELNRLTQAQILCENEERALQEQITELQRRSRGEKRFIVEVEAYRAKECVELQAQLDQWQKNYALEMERQCAETQRQEQRQLDLRKMHERHLETLAERQQFVQDYLAEKEAQRLLYEQQQHRINCAIRIQAWWRGTMVRRGLGPFKKKTKKGKKGKGKAK